MDVLQTTVNVLSSLLIPFTIEEEAILLNDGTSIKIREKSLQISKEVLQDPTEKQKSVAFWYEKQRLAEATFFLAEKNEKGEECLLLAVRIPVPSGKSSRRVRSWRPFVEEALRQIHVGEKKIYDGSWGDVKPKANKERK